MVGNGGVAAMAARQAKNGYKAAKPDKPLHLYKLAGYRVGGKLCQLLAAGGGRQRRRQPGTAALLFHHPGGPAPISPLDSVTMYDPLLIPYCYFSLRVCCKILGFAHLQPGGQP